MTKAITMTMATMMTKAIMITKKLFDTPDSDEGGSRRVICGGR